MAAKRKVSEPLPEGIFAPDLPYPPGKPSDDKGNHSLAGGCEKRVRFAADNKLPGQHRGLLASRHPYGVQPGGNRLLLAHGVGESDSGWAGDVVIHRAPGLGLFARLPDELLYEVISCLSPAALAMLAQASRYLYIFTHQPDLWREHVLTAFGRLGFTYATSWKDTFVTEYCRRVLHCHDVQPPHAPLTRGTVFSDYLYQPWFCASVDIKPRWVQGQNIPRAAGLTTAEFVSEYELPGRPVILTDIVRQWACDGLWDESYLARLFGESLMEAGPAQLTFGQYFEYARQTIEDRPLYVFDKRFVDKAPAVADDYRWV